VSLESGDEHRERWKPHAKTHDRPRNRYQYVDIPLDAHRNQSFCIKLLGAVAGLGLAFALATARDVRLFYPLFIPVRWIALRYGVPGAMISVSLAQAALVSALELTPGSITLFDVQFPLLSLGITAPFLGP
jgi:glucose-6-phosphate-specific signal transduction histidine kinase